MEPHAAEPTVGRPRRRYLARISNLFGSGFLSIASTPRSRTKHVLTVPETASDAEGFATACCLLPDVETSARPRYIGRVHKSVHKLLLTVLRRLSNLLCAVSCPCPGALGLVIDQSRTRKHGVSRFGCSASRSASMRTRQRRLS